MPNTIEIEVVYCSSDAQQLRPLQLAAGSRVADVLAQPGLLSGLGIESSNDLQFGVFGKKCNHTLTLQHLDRLEIYRPLLLSPTEARRLRAQTLKGQ